MKRVFLILFSALIFFSCSQTSTEKISNSGLEYARGFTITSYDGYSIVEVRNPWDTLSLLQRYALVKRGDTLSVQIPNCRVIYIPVEKIAISSTVDAGAIEMLGSIESVVAVCEPEYMKNSAINSGVASGQIADLGRATRPSFESLLASEAQIIITSPFENQGYGAIEESSVAIVECASYTENTPLGRAEWIKFYAAFLDKAALAEQLFVVERDRYNSLKSRASDVGHRPMLMAGKCYGRVWNISSGDSYAANLYLDAGAGYPWSDLQGDVYAPMSPESVAVTSEECDLWVIPYYNEGGDITMEMLKDEFELYSKLRPYRNGNVYGANTAVKLLYEQTPFAPSLYLEDLIRIVHPNLLEQGEMRYFSRLK